MVIVPICPDFSSVLSMDNYLDSTRKVIDENFDDSRLIDFELLRKNVMVLASVILACSNRQDIKAGEPTEMPLYDFRRSGRYAYKTVHPPASHVHYIFRLALMCIGADCGRHVCSTSLHSELARFTSMFFFISSM